MAVGLAVNCLGLLVELGRSQQALDQAVSIAAAAEASGDTFMVFEPRAVELTTQLNQGHTHDATSRADWLVATARELANATDSVLGLAAAAAARLATRQPDQARELLAELEQTAGAHESSYYPRQLPWMVRTALAAGDPTLASTLTDRLQPHFPLHQHALTACRALLAEHAGDHAQAASLYADAAQRWHEFGNVPERAYALLGQGRCLAALGEPAAREAAS